MNGSRRSIKPGLRTAKNGEIVGSDVSQPMNRLRLFSLLAFSVAILFCLLTYLDGRGSRVSEARVYQELPTKKLLLCLQGQPAQDAANHFLFRSGAWSDGPDSLVSDRGNWVTVEFWDGNLKTQETSFGLRNSKTDIALGGGYKYLTQDSRIYWKKLVAIRRSSLHE